MTASPYDGSDWVAEHQTKAGSADADSEYRPHGLGHGLSKRQLYQRVLELMRQERLTFDEHWKAIADVTQPRRVRFDNTSRNRTSRNDGIYNGKMRTDSRTLVSGLFARICSPTDDWFGMGPPDPDLAIQDEEVAIFFDGEVKGCRKTLEDADFYRASEQCIQDMVDMATGAMFLDDDPFTLLRAYHMPVGSYFLGSSARGEIDTCIREFGMTVAEMVEKFPWENLSLRVQQFWERGYITQWIDVVHVVAPNREYQPGKMTYGASGFQLSKRWSSCFYEKDGPPERGFLEERGYYEFPIIVGRWATTGEDIYGTGCPGMDALADARELQELAIDSGALVAKLVRPPLGAPASMNGQKISLIPGDITYLDNASIGDGVKPLIDVHPQGLIGVNTKEGLIEKRISDAYYARLWLMLNEGEGGSRMTAAEIHERRAEKMSQLGPLTNRFQQEFLRKAVMRVFMARLRAGLVKDWPEALDGQPVKVEFKSEFSQAQKATAALTLDRLVTFAGTWAQASGNPQIFDNLDDIEAVAAYADGLGAPPRITRPVKDVRGLRAARAEQADQAESAAKAAATAAVLKDMSAAKVNRGNALGQLMEGMRGAA